MEFLNITLRHRWRRHLADRIRKSGDAWIILTRSKIPTKTTGEIFISHWLRTRCCELMHPIIRTYCAGCSWREERTVWNWLPAKICRRRLRLPFNSVLGFRSIFIVSYFALPSEKINSGIFTSQFYWIQLYSMGYSDWQDKWDKFFLFIWENTTELMNEQNSLNRTCWNWFDVQIKRRKTETD